MIRGPAEGAEMLFGMGDLADALGILELEGNAERS